MSNRMQVTLSRTILAAGPAFEITVTVSTEWPMLIKLLMHPRHRGYPSTLWELSREDVHKVCRNPNILIRPEGGNVHMRADEENLYITLRPGDEDRRTCLSMDLGDLLEVLDCIELFEEHNKPPEPLTAELFKEDQ